MFAIKATRVKICFIFLGLKLFKIQLPQNDWMVACKRTGLVEQGRMKYPVVGVIDTLGYKICGIVP